MWVSLGQPIKKSMTLAGKAYTTQTFFDPSGNPTPDNRYRAYTRNVERRTTSMNALVANAYSTLAMQSIVLMHY